MRLEEQSTPDLEDMILKLQNRWDWLSVNVPESRVEFFQIHQLATSITKELKRRMTDA